MYKYLIERKVLVDKHYLCINLRMIKMYMVDEINKQEEHGLQ